MEGMGNAMTLGASTACLYPMPTELALEELLRLGFRTLEVFVNTASETTPEFARGLRRRADQEDARIVAVHPYTSGMEPYLLFSGYARRTEDAMDQYRGFFSAASAMGARYLVLHGDRADSALPLEESAGRLDRLFEIGREEGVMPLLENVVKYRSADPQYLRDLRRLLGDRIGFVFDFKQCARCGLQIEEVLDAMGQGLAHLHVSDQDTTHDCLIPGRGKNDFAAVARRLHSMGFDGSWILELYRSNFEFPSDLAEGVRKLGKMEIL